MLRVRGGIDDIDVVDNGWRLQDWYLNAVTDSPRKGNFSLFTVAFGSIGGVALPFVFQ